MKKDWKTKVVCSELNNLKKFRLNDLPNYTTFRLGLENEHKIAHGQVIKILDDLQSSSEYAEIISRIKDR